MKSADTRKNSKELLGPPPRTRSIEGGTTSEQGYVMRPSVLSSGGLIMLYMTLAILYGGRGRQGDTGMFPMKPSFENSQRAFCRFGA